MSGLSREQLNICYRANDVTIAALDGLDLAVRECQFQVCGMSKKNSFILSFFFPIELYVFMCHTWESIQLYY